MTRRPATREDPRLTSVVNLAPVADLEGKAAEMIVIEVAQDPVVADSVAPES